MNLKRHTQLATLCVGIGLALMIMMIAVEDEPGGIPILLILLGAGWYVISQIRLRSRGTE